MFTTSASALDSFNRAAISFANPFISFVDGIIDCVCDTMEDSCEVEAQAAPATANTVDRFSEKTSLVWDCTCGKSNIRIGFCPCCGNKRTVSEVLTMANVKTISVTTTKTPAIIRIASAIPLASGQPETVPPSSRLLPFRRLLFAERHFSSRKKAPG